MLSKRASGLLLHVTSLPSPFGIGDLGPSAYRFIDFLVDAGQRVWQILPTVPVGLGNSPYSSPSTFAGNPMLISPEKLTALGLLEEADWKDLPTFPEDKVDFGDVYAFKKGLLDLAFSRFEANKYPELHGMLWKFAAEQSYWLDDYALFMAFQDVWGGPWTSWPAEIVQRNPSALHYAKEQHKQGFKKHQFLQMLYFMQWEALHTYAKEKGVAIMGDLPIYVAHDSADVWAQQHMFYLAPNGEPTVVAGVPPDYFSETGQRWGNPLYRWDLMKADGYAWWMRRLRHVFLQCDILRLDHFRAFAGYWEIPASEPTAVNGRWMPGPGASFFHTVRDRLGNLPILAEDLGEITPDVVELMHQFNLPGMAVLQFAFNGKASSHFLPHNYVKNLVAYSGTHDNNTMMGWFEEEKNAESVSYLHVTSYLDLSDEATDVHWTINRALLSSVANLVILPVQDVLGLGADARMNTPGSNEGNWGWRLREEALTEDVADQLNTLCLLYGRA